MSDVPPPGTSPAAPPATDASPAAEPAGASFEVPWADGQGGPARPPGAAPRWQRRRRGNARWRAAFFALAGLAAVVLAGWALFGNRLLVVRSVTVTGTHLLAPAQVIAAADVAPGTPLLTVDTGAVTRRVAGIRQVASVTVTEEWPDRLVVAVTERVPAVAVRMAGGGYDLVDPAGVIVQWARARPATLPLLATSLPGSALPGNPDVTTAARVLAELQPWLARQVAQVSVAALPTGPRQVTLGLRDGKTVVWGGTDNAAQKNRELAVLLTGQARAVDVSAPGTAVTR